MIDIEIVEVKSAKEQRIFNDLVGLVYKDDVNYARPLDSLINNIFSPKTNPFYKHGSAVRFILFKKGKAIGRVAAFINDKKAFGFDQPTGGMGFFECINDKDIAFLLFNTAKKWLADRGMEAMDGPINFGENDNFWGLLVDGFTQASFGMQYNPPYYQRFFEEYGFKTYFEQITNKLDLEKSFPERFWKIAKWVVGKKDYSFKHFSVKDKDKFLADFKTIYDDAWQFHENFTPIDIKILDEAVDKSKSFLWEDIVWFAYHKDKPIGFLVLFPDINQVIKRYHGKMNLFNKLYFIRAMKKDTITRARVVIMGIIPKFQKMGIESGLFWSLKSVVDKKYSLNELELSWVGDFNPKMRVLHESVGADFSKKHITYRYVFNGAENNNERATTIPFGTKTNKK